MGIAEEFSVVEDKDIRSIMKIVGRLQGIEDSEIPFVLEDDKITIVGDSNFYFLFPMEEQRFNLVRGETNDNRNV